MTLAKAIKLSGLLLELPCPAIGMKIPKTVFVSEQKYIKGIIWPII